MALTRVQATPTATTTAATVPLVFATPPAVGHGVVAVGLNRLGAFPTGGCTDNYGNPYTQVIARAGSQSFIAIYVCSAVVTTGPSFTVSLGGVPTFGNLTGIALEVDSALVVDQSAGATASSMTPASGATPALTTTGAVFAVAGVALRTVQSGAIVVAPVSPAWLQEFDNFATQMYGEVDSRTIPAAGGTVQTVTWTIPTTSQWGAVLALFKDAAPAASEQVSTFVVLPG